MDLGDSLITGHFSNNGSLNSTTSVTIVPAPSGSNKFLVFNATFYNNDTAPVNLTISLKDSAGSTSTIKQVILNAGDVTSIEDIILDTTTKSIVAVLGASVAANQPNFTAAYGQAAA